MIAMQIEHLSQFVKARQPGRVAYMPCSSLNAKFTFKGIDV